MPVNTRSPDGEIASEVIDVKFRAFPGISTTEELIYIES